MQSHKEAWGSTFPQGLRYGDAKQEPVNKLGGTPPIWLVPQVHETVETSKATVTIKLTSKAKDTYVKFTDRTPEAGVRHVKLFYSLVDKMELMSQFETEQDTLKSNRELIRELGPIRPNSPSDEIQQKQDLEEENKTIIKDMVTLKRSIGRSLSNS